jgi:uncharacterized protein
MEDNVMWVPCTGAGLEHLHLLQHDEGNVSDSVVIGMEQETPFRLWYEIHTDKDWKVRQCTLRLLGGGNREITLQGDGDGHWTDAAGIPLSALDGCIDVDISVTPFTNTLPIRRLSLQPGQSADLLVAYITVPMLELKMMQQRYTCLEHHADGSIYRYESLGSGFTRDLLVDAQGLVIDYPEIWQRVGPDFSLVVDSG